METIDDVERTTFGLRDALFDEMDALRRGTSTPQRASAVSKLAVQIINSANMEIEYQKLAAENKQIEGQLLASPVLLGSSDVVN